MASDENLWPQAWAVLETRSWKSPSARAWKFCRVRTLIMIICRFHGPLARYVKLRVCMRRECWERFPRHLRLAISTCIMAGDARAVMHAGIANWRFPLKSVVGENVPGIPSACSTRNFTYLVRGPLLEVTTYIVSLWGIWSKLTVL